jgi:hypothetical protein
MLWQLVSDVLHGACASSGAQQSQLTPAAHAICTHTRTHPHSRRGKWSSASAEEVAAEMAKGTPYCYRFRVPPNKEVSVCVGGGGVCVLYGEALGRQPRVRGSHHSWCVCAAMREPTHTTPHNPHPTPPPAATPLRATQQTGEHQ